MTGWIMAGTKGFESDATLGDWLGQAPSLCGIPTAQITRRYVLADTGNITVSTSGLHSPRRISALLGCFRARSDAT